MSESEKHSPPWMSLDEEQEEFERNRNIDWAKIKEIGSQLSTNITQKGREKNGAIPHDDDKEV